MKTIAILNQKGGCGKSTAALCLGAGLHRAGLNVLHIDLDSQGSLSLILRAVKGPNIYDALIDGKPIGRTIQNTPQGALIAADSRLAKRGLLTRPGDTSRLKTALEPLQSRFDVALLDCPPALSAMSMSALIAADAVVIPARADRLSLNALQELHSTIAAVKNGTDKAPGPNPALKVYGILITQYDGRTTAARLILDEIKAQAAQLGMSVYDPPTRRAVIFDEIQITGGTIYDSPRSKATQDYQAIVNQLMNQMKGA